MAAGAGNEKKRKKRNFSPAPGLNPGRQLRWSSDLPERLAFQAKIPKSIVRLIMLPANIYCERRGSRFKLYDLAGDWTTVRRSLRQLLC